MATTRTRIPIAHGVGNDTDPRVRAPEKLKRAINVYQPVTGRLEKRNGFSVLSRLDSAGNNIDTEGPIRGLARTSKELLAIGHRTLFAWSPEAARWIARGRVSPCIGETRECFRSSAKYSAGDMSVGANYQLFASEAERVGVSSGSPFSSHWIEVEARAIDTGEVVMSTRLEVVTNNQHPRMPRCMYVSASGAHYIVIARDYATPAELIVYRWNESSPLSAPAAVLSPVTTDLYVESGRPARTFDAIAFDTGWALAWIDDSTKDVELRKYDTSDAQTQTSSITHAADENFIRVALETASTRLVVMVVQDFVISGIDEVEVYARTTTLAADWGPQVIGTGASGIEFDDISVKQIVTSAGDTRLTCSWLRFTNILNHGLTNIFRTYNITLVPSTGASSEAAVFVPNMGPVGRPFGYRNRVYQHLSYNVGPEFASSSPTTSNAIGFCHHALVEWNSGMGDERNPVKMAALWDVGLAVPGNEILRNGNCAQWSVLPDTKTFVGMFPVLAEAIAGDSTAEQHVAWDEVRLEFDAPVLAAACLPDCAVIGGGYVAWYDGVETMELHMPTAFIDHTTETGATGNLADGTYTYSIVPERQDHAGVLHRGPPSPPLQVTVTGGTPQHVKVGGRTYQLTHHPEHALGWRYFRSTVADPVLRRVSKNNSLGANDNTSDLTEDFEDGLFTVLVPTVPIYTTGGVLETVSPEGAQIPLVARNKLWLARFFRRSRLQFSQDITPASAGETVVAPQMMELFGRLLLSGEGILGMAQLDESTVILTRRGVHLISGDGPDATGRGDTMSRVVDLPTDAGAIDPRSVVTFPGGVLFRSERCFYKFTREHGLEAIGERVKSVADGFPVTTSAVVMPDHQHVRFTVTTAVGGQGRDLVYDYRHDEWYEWNVLQAGGSATAFVGGVYHNGVYYVVMSNGEVFWEDESTYKDDTTQYVETELWTGWLQPAGPGSWNRYSRVDILGDRRDSCSLTLNLYVDYDEISPAETVTYNAAEIAALPAPGTRLEIAHEPQVSQAQAMSVQLLETPDSPTTGAGYAIAAIGVDVQPIGGAQRGTRQAVA